MSFDRVATHYRWLETLAFWNQLQQARVAFVGEIESPGRILIVGEGNGRFLAEFVKTHPDSAVDCIDASGRMIELARRRIDDERRVSFIRADLRDVLLEAERYDLIVTHFFFDCFAERTLAALIAKLANSAAPNAQWLIADFCGPSKGWRKLRARFLIVVMYCFFRALTGIEARRLVDYRPFLRAQGFGLVQSLVSPNEMICSERWRRTPPPG